MIESYILELCKKDEQILKLKIANTEYAIYEAEQIIKESLTDKELLILLRRKIAEAKIDLEVLYLIKR